MPDLTKLRFKCGKMDQRLKIKEKRYIKMYESDKYLKNKKAE